MFLGIFSYSLSLSDTSLFFYRKTKRIRIQTMKPIMEFGEVPDQKRIVKNRNKLPKVVRLVSMN